MQARPAKKARTAKKRTAKKRTAKKRTAKKRTAKKRRRVTLRRLGRDWKRARRWRCRSKRCRAAKQRRKMRFYLRLRALRHAIARRQARRHVKVTIARARVEGGEHLRVHSRYGVWHLWRPEHYDAARAGIVIYHHGYTNSADRSWKQFRLPPQFARSKRNALFIVPDGPHRRWHPLRWPTLDGLLAAVRKVAKIEVPERGPIVVVAHSAGFRTLESWVGKSGGAHDRVREVILLDALYGSTKPFRDWIEGNAKRRMIIVGADTRRQAYWFARAKPYGVRRRRIPHELSAFSAREREARVLYLRSQLDHSSMVKAAWVLPMLLEMVELPKIGPPNS
ncbi:MAG: hypothetical protein KC503_42280 [Myxococcales bacterium]|nr:hypothetical protein [Myxococcales bacterium]